MLTTDDYGATHEASSVSPATVPIEARQPVIGLLGFAIIAVVLYLLFILPGLERSLLVLGPLSTFWLPVLVVSALWWGGWPGNKIKDGRLGAGAGNTVLFVAAAIGLTIIGMLIVGPTDVGGIFSSGIDNTTFPWTLPLAAVVFVVMLQLTFVSGKWPLQKLEPVTSGFAALALTWAIALIIYFIFVDWASVAPPQVLDAVGMRDPGGIMHALEFVGLLLTIVIWQMTFFVLLGGWPFTLIEPAATRLVASHAVVIGGGWVTYLILHDGIDLTVAQIGAIGGSVTAAIFVSAMLFETWPLQKSPPATLRAGIGAVTVGLTFAAYFGLRAMGEAIETFEAAPSELWVAIATLNFVAAMVILHYVVWGRWPLAAPAPPPQQ
ncbi:MAG: hypothetical protein ACE5E8_08510 [Acidimicrobiia bacterium]